MHICQVGKNRGCKNGLSSTSTALSNTPSVNDASNTFSQDLVAHRVPLEGKGVTPTKESSQSHGGSCLRLAHLDTAIFIHFCHMVGVIFLLANKSPPLPWFSCQQAIHFQDLLIFYFTILSRPLPYRVASAFFNNWHWFVNICFQVVHKINKGN